MIKVKICGIREMEDMLIAIDAGADAIGFVCGFTDSPRDISIERVIELSENAPIFTSCVLVTNGNTLLENFESLKGSRISAVQLYDGSKELALRLKEIGISVIHPVRSIEKDLSDIYDAFLVDTFESEKSGGTGKLVDYEFANKVKKLVYPKPIILAGGLTPKNVRQAVKAVKPFAVDVSSGVEMYPGKKDPDKVLAFIKQAKSVRT